MKTVNSSIALISGLLLSSVTLTQLAQASPLFQAADVVASSAFAQSAEGKCGEGRCAAAKLDTNGDGKVSYQEAEAAGFSEVQCKTWDKNTDGTLEANELAAMHAILDPPISQPRKRGSR